MKNKPLKIQRDWVKMLKIILTLGQYIQMKTQFHNFKKQIIKFKMNIGKLNNLLSIYKMQIMLKNKLLTEHIQFNFKCRN